MTESAVQSHQKLRAIMPRTWSSVERRSVQLAGVSLECLASTCDTPLYVMDEKHLVHRLDAYSTAFGAGVEPVFAAKSFFCVAMARLLVEHGWRADVVSTGELAVALAGEIEPERVLFHGNGKPPTEIDVAVAAGVGRVVVDGPDELPVIAAAGDRHGTAVSVLLRLNADVGAVTHAKIKTTGARTQFGMRPDTLARAAERAVDLGLRVRGVHIHAGSQITDPATHGRAARQAVEMALRVQPHLSGPIEIDVGGGLAAAYVAGDQVPEIATLAAHILPERERAVAELGDVTFLVEPGRSVVANAGITLYRVISRKTLADGRVTLAVDGGMTDNLRPSLYGARYTLVSVERPTAAHDTAFTVVGRHCESGDVVAEDARLPADTGPGDVVAVLATGAYGYSMSSRYNGLPRPAVVWVRDGAARTVVRRETIADLLACDLDPPGVI